MTFDSFFNALLITENNSLGIWELVTTILLPFFLAFPITWTYRRTHRHSNYSITFVHTIFLFASLSGIITLLIGNNIARAFGLVGALSVIRFRNALKDPIDAVYVFWALAIGMACGTGFYFAATVVVAFMVVMVHFLNYTNYGAPKYQNSLLKVSVQPNNETDTIQTLEQKLKHEGRQFEALNVYFDGEKDRKTYVYSLKNHRKVRGRNLETDLAGIQGICQIEHLSQPNTLLTDQKA